MTAKLATFGLFLLVQACTSQSSQVCCSFTDESHTVFTAIHKGYQTVAPHLRTTAEQPVKGGTAATLT